MAERRILEMFESDPAGSHLYARLLVEASIADRVVSAAGRSVSLKRGQLVFGRSAWQKKTGLSEKVIRRVLKQLEEVGELGQQNYGKFTVISIASMMNGPAQGQQKARSRPAESHSYKREDGDKEKEVIKESCRAEPDPRVSQVIGLLNEMTGSKYRTTAKGHSQNINARLSEGHPLDDLLAVVRHKTGEWGSDPRMAQYLRPETLFGNKFQGYLLAAKVPATMPAKATGRHDLSNIRYEDETL